MSVAAAETEQLSTEERLRRLQGNLAEYAAEVRGNRLLHYKPYAKQQTFHDAGAAYRERLFLAGNQVGKTTAGAMEFAMHTTGNYPSWWQGKRWNRPIRAWFVGITNENVRDNAQRLLLGGGPEEIGSGAIPRECIRNPRWLTGIRDALDTVGIQHVSGGTSYVASKSYEKGRTKLQGQTLDLVWCDEEPPEDIYSELLARISARRGMIYLTATPLLGMSDVISRFYEEDAHRFRVQMELSEAEHFPVEDREAIEMAYPEHEREARTKGIPMLGSGRVFPVAQKDIEVEAFSIPDSWPRICGIDIGFEHPFAAAWLAYDPDADCVYVYDVYKKAKEVLSIHAHAIRTHGDWIPVAWPKDATLLVESLRKEHKLNMLGDYATFDDGDMRVETGVLSMHTRMREGRLKVFSHLEPFWEEFRRYHRKKGKIVRAFDDILAATRYAMAGLRYARSARQHRLAKAKLKYPKRVYV